MTLIDMFPSVFWYELGFGVSLMLNLILLIVVIGIIYPFKEVIASSVNRDMLYIILGVLFGILGNMVVAVMTQSPPFNNPIMAIIVMGGFCGTLFYGLLKIQK